MEKDRDLVSPCGLDCFNCPFYVKNISEEMIIKLLGQVKVERDKVLCRGCRKQKGCRLFLTSCPTLECVTKRGLEFCFECEEFPCSKLQPASDAADRYPHNMKVFNLCRMKLVGIEVWADEEAAKIREKYFEGKFVPGDGPKLL